MHATPRRVALVVLLTLAGCSPEPIDERVEQFVTIAQGVYGQATLLGDLRADDPDYLSGLRVDVYPAPPVSAAPGDELGTPVASTESGWHGFFEVALEPGGYVVCTGYGDCAAVTIAAGELARLDYQVGPGPGWSAR